jgi:hypothetical protein
MGATIVFLLSTAVLAGGVLAGVAAGRSRRPPTRRGRRLRDRTGRERRDARDLETKHRSRTTRPDD